MLEGLFIGTLFGLGFALMLCWWQSMRDGDDVFAIIAGTLGMGAITTATIVSLALLEAL